MYFDQVLHQMRLEDDGSLSELQWRDGRHRFVAAREGEVSEA